MIWRIGAIVTAALVALPLLGLASSLLAARGEMWRHLAETQLGDIIANTAVLLLGVGVGTTAIGTGTAWLVTMHRFPLSRTFEWGLILPLVLPTYIIGYAYADLLAFAGPLQGGLREITGWQRGRLLVPRALLRAGRRRALHARALSLRLSRRPGRVPHPVAAASRSEPHPGPRSMANLLRRRPADGSPGDRGGSSPGAVRGVGRLRHGPILRRADLHDGDLSHLVRHGRSRRRRAGRRGPARHRRAADRARTPLARSRALPCRVEPARERRSRRPRRLARRRCRRRPARCRCCWASPCPRSISSSSPPARTCRWRHRPCCATRCTACCSRRSPPS